MSELDDIARSLPLSDMASCLQGEERWQQQRAEALDVLFIRHASAAPPRRDGRPQYHYFDVATDRWVLEE